MPKYDYRILFKTQEVSTGVYSSSQSPKRTLKICISAIVLNLNAIITNIGLELEAL